jgi:hypothetical protein
MRHDRAARRRWCPRRRWRRRRSGSRRRRSSAKTLTRPLPRAGEGESDQVEAEAAVVRPIRPPTMTSLG